MNSSHYLNYDIVNRTEVFSLQVKEKKVIKHLNSLIVGENNIGSSKEYKSL